MASFVGSHALQQPPVQGKLREYGYEDCSAERSARNRREGVTPFGTLVRSGVMPDFQQDPDGIWRDGFLLDLLSRELS
jgi:hypothetical protein